MSENVRSRMCAHAPSEDSDQPAHARSLIRIFTGHILDSQRCKVFLSMRATKILIAVWQSLRCPHEGAFHPCLCEMHPVKIQISLRIRAVWLESSLGTFWTAKDAKFLRHAGNKNSDCSLTESSLSVWRSFSSLLVWNAPSEDSDQPAHSRNLIRIFTGHILDSQGCKVS